MTRVLFYLEVPFIYNQLEIDIDICGIATALGQVYAFGQRHDRTFNPGDVIDLPSISGDDLFRFRGSNERFSLHVGRATL